MENIQPDSAGGEATERLARLDFDTLYARSNLTRKQLGIWLAHQIEPTRSGYFMAVAHHILGPVDVGLFQRAFRMVGAASDVLRVVVEPVDGVPRQRLLDELPAELEFIDLGAESDAELALQAALSDRQDRTPPIETCSFDGALYRVTDDHYVWYLAQHHLLTDGWSAGLALERIAEAYSELSAGNESPLSYPAFLDVVPTMRDQETSQRAARARAFWDDYLRQGSGPIFRSRLGTPARMQFRFLDLSDADHQALNDFATNPPAPVTSTDAALLQLFTTAFAITLYKLCRRDRLSLEIPFHNRDRSRKKVAGFFSTGAPMLLSVDEGTTFAALFATVGNELPGLFRHARYAPDYDLSEPLFDVGVNYINAPICDFLGSPVVSRKLHSKFGRESVRLEIERRTTSSLRLNLICNSELLAESDQQMLLDYLYTVLQKGWDDPSLRLSELDTPTARLPSLAPAPVRSLVERPYVAPENDAERTIAAVWASLLGRERVGRNDNFFELGGDSVLTLQVIGEARRRGLDFTPQNVFEYPTVAALAAVAAPVSVEPEAKPSVPLTTQPAGVTTAATRSTDGGAFPAEDEYGLSPVQEGILYHSLAEPESAVYLGQALFTMQDLSVDDWRAAWQTAIDRHPALRTAFRIDDRLEPMQVVMSQVALQLSVEDLRDLPEHTQAERIETVSRDDRYRAMELESAPLMRMRCLRVNERETRIVWTCHHLILDGWSAAIIVKEVFAAYANNAVAAESPERQFKDYVAWLAEQPEQPARQFWTRYLSGCTATELPLTSDAGAEPAVRQVTLSPQLSQSLVHFARDHALTLNTVVQGALALLLARYTHGDDIVFGVTVAGRTAHLPGSDAMIGMFINTLPVRAQLAADINVLEWLRDLQADRASAIAFDHTSLAQIQSWSGHGPQQPLFDTLLVVENFPLDTGLLGQAGVRDISIRQQTNYPLTLTVMPGEAICLEAASARFSGVDLEGVLAHFEHLLLQLSRGADQRLGQIGLLSPAQRTRLLTWGTGVTQPPPRRSVWQSVGEQARRTPDAVALRFRDQAFSYRELQERADRLAARLCATGIGPGDVVGVCLPRHPDLVTALLAVQQSGAAYLPLDPEYPAARIEYCLHDAAAKAVVTHSAVTGSLPATMATITLDTLADEVTQAAPRSDFDAEAPAYLIYTSGSTGKPKGVVISHGALAQFLQGISTVTPLSATDTLLAVTTPAFDIAGLELYLPLLNGAVLALADGDSQRDPELLKAALEDTGATVMQATPATWRLLLATGWRAPSRFRALIGGEALPRELARQLLDSGVRLFNLYGPTEATIWATSAPIESTDDGIPLGRPLPNTVLRVLDDAGSLCPIGVEGELHIGGAQLAAGYHDRPELTADRFVQHREFGRLYRTGDRVRFDQAGHLHFLGRTDFQIKLRGFRIELGDIESTLEAHAAISQAVACVHTFKEGDVRLVAYLVHRPATQSSVAELRQHVLQHLPAYMCPQHFVSLEQMPLTPNGKVDRKALPPPWHPTAAEAPAEAPASDTERMLASLWQQMLGRYPNRHDDFFAAGGHSLTAVRMIGRISQSFGVRIPLNEILETPTVAALAEHIEVIRGLQLQEERAADDIAEREEIVL